ncbi:MAG: sugar phosphate isomerase/epimerase [Clostridiales bacterium]|nr:sugar phosphate isomerase/epimerase [Clostridiales bacterium]
MNICTQTHLFIDNYGEEKGIELLAKAGFESIDFSMFYPVDSGILVASDDEVREHFEKLRRHIENCGMYVYQTHTPFPTYRADPEKDEVIFKAECKALLASSVLGAKYAVVHPAIMRENRYGSLSAENKAINVDLYSRLIPYLDKYDIKIAIENMFNHDPEKNCICPTVCSSSVELADYVDTMNALCKNGDRFVNCLDIGHTNLSGDKPIGDMVRTLGPRLKSLHIHDNNGIYDMHTAPGFGNIKWGEFCTALKDIGYDGDFVFEADSFYRCFDSSLMFDAGALLYKIGRNLVDKYGL